MSYEVPVAPGDTPQDIQFGGGAEHGFPLWEVFVRAKRGLNHTHVGSLHAPDAETAIHTLAREIPGDESIHSCLIPNR